MNYENTKQENVLDIIAIFISIMSILQESTVHARCECC